MISQGGSYTGNLFPSARAMPLKLSERDELDANLDRTFALCKYCDLGSILSAPLQKISAAFIDNKRKGF